MSTILALDTSTDACSVALNIDGTITSYFEIASKSHTQRLLPMVDEILKQSQLTLSDLDAIAFGRGPGSFTGLRICAGIVQGLAFGANLPVIPVSTLQSMALQFFRKNPDVSARVLTSLDARMDEVYWAVYEQIDADRHHITAAPVIEEAVNAPADVILACDAQTDLIGVGSGWTYSELAALSPKLIDTDIQPRAEEIAIIASDLFGSGVKVSALDAQPVYLRDTVSWQKRKRIRTIDNI